MLLFHFVNIFDFLLSDDIFYFDSVYNTLFAHVFFEDKWEWYVS